MKGKDIPEEEQVEMAYERVQESLQEFPRLLGLFGKRFDLERARRFRGRAPVFDCGDSPGYCFDVRSFSET